ncbi:MAG: NADH-quinone oxidoreductase subunit H, partial [Candidatus Marinimicrobia bacterium]|nr:NADH-quinone oxidoreductase subunit H [Candidatus Neomarinimicrobiota bacterium]
MIVDYLIDIIPFAADWPGLVFVSVVIFCAVPVFLFIAVYALVAIYGELKVSSFMQDKIGPMGQG